MNPWACLLVEIGIYISIRILHTEFLLDIGYPRHKRFQLYVELIFPRYGNSSNMFWRYAKGSTPFAFALSTREYTMELATAPFVVSQNSPFFRPKVNGWNLPAVE